MPSPRRDEDRVQLDQDVNDVFVLGIKKASDFDEPYRQTIIDAYRFSATRYNSDEESNANISPDTLDII